MNKFNFTRGIQLNVCSILLMVIGLSLSTVDARAQLFGKRGGGGKDAEAPAQIDGDTIKIAAGKSSFLKVIGPVRSINPLSEDYGYTCTEGTGNIYLRAKNSSPEKFSQLIVNEGPESSVRQHIFVLQYVKTMDLADQTHDLSSISKIRERMAFLESQKGSGDEGVSAQPDEEEEPKAKVAKVEKPKAEKPKMDKPKLEKPKAQTPKVETPKAEVPKVEKPVAEKPAKTSKGEKSSKTKASDEEQTEEEEPQTAKTTPRQNTKGSSGESGGVYKGEGEEDRKSIANDDVISNIPPEVLTKRVKVTIDRFYHHCTELSAKRSIEMNMKECMKLFNNDTSVTVERTNARTGARRSDKIRRYLRNLTQLSYSSVEVTAANINFVSGEARKGPDGKYHATAVVLQDFKGFKDDIPVYQDQTAKTIEIILDVFEAMKDGERVKVLQVFLGDISVSDQN